MKNLAKLLICCSCLNSSAFSYGMQESLYQDIFSLETSEAWKKYESPRKHVSTVDESCNIAQALSDVKACGKDDKIAKYLVENIFLLCGSNERKSCWIKCYNTWKKANDLLAALAIGLERIDCDDEMRAYQLAASDLVANRIKEIHIAQFLQYDRKQGKFERHSTGHFKENHDADQSATRRLYDAMTPIMNIMRQSNYAFTPVFPDVCFFMMATPDDLKIGEAIYWQREADLLLFDAQTSLLLEMDPQVADAIREALTLRNESLLPPAKQGSQFDKILKDSGLLRKANAILEECISDREPPVSEAMAIVNKCKNLARIGCITADEKGIMMQNSVDAFFDMFARKHLGQFLFATAEPRISSSMIKELKNYFASLREIMIAYVNFHSANVESISEALTSFEEMINGMRMTEFVKIIKGIPHEIMTQLMSITPEKFAQLKDAKDNQLVRVVDYIPAEMRWILDLIPSHRHNPTAWCVPREEIISKESMEHLTALTPEILQQLQEMPAFMRELFMKTPIEFAEIVDCEIDVTCRIIKLLAERANLICKKDGDIKLYTEEWIQYIFAVLEDLKETELNYRTQLALQSASEIVMHNRLSGAFGGSYTTESVLDCFLDLIKSSIQKTAITDIMNEVLGASDVQVARTKIVSEYFRIFTKEFGENVALELIHHRSVNSQNKALYDKYVKELNATTKTYLLNNTAKMIEISLRLYGDTSHATQLIDMISQVDNPYKVYELLDNDIEYLLQESLLKDYIRGIRKIQIKDTVLSL